VGSGDLDHLEYRQQKTPSPSPILQATSLDLGWKNRDRHGMKIEFLLFYSNEHIKQK
jgi:hypothetical protein